ncbi:uncharacterized protein TrAFT101_005715 [Trichoderma asperellum]|uniref:uncharacterized protein n=1 Tax=Trichoderma asperellum TaxID=101201 RepID=UPI003324FE61|nr:hypothetical protein TrAFT101_005715 [Trichoderma asperellum]
MGSTVTIIPPGGLVLVSGVSGFIGSHIALNLVKLGYKVRGTVRSEDKATWIKEAVAYYYPFASFEAALVPDITAAGDMSFGADPNKIITPMVNSVRNLLETATKEPSVKRFVFTSSNQAALNRTLGKEFMVDKTAFNEASVAAAWRPPPYEPDRIWDVYSALKTQIEQEVWKFTREEKPKLVVNSVLPCFIVGPIIHPKQSGSTGKWVMDFWKDAGHFAPLQGFGGSYFVDADDTALLHIAGLTQEDVKNERLFGFAGIFNFNTWVSVFRQLDPSRPWPADDPNQQSDLSKVDDARELELLKRFGYNGWTSFFDSVKKTVQESRQ